MLEEELVRRLSRVRQVAEALLVEAALEDARHEVDRVPREVRAEATKIKLNVEVCRLLALVRGLYNKLVVPLVLLATANFLKWPLFRE